MTVFYGLVGGAVGTYVILSDRAETAARVVQSAESYARLFEEHVNRTLDAAEMTALRVGERAVAGARDEVVGGPLRDAPHLVNVVVVDATGRVMADARGAHRPGEDLSAQPWVRALGEGEGTVIGAAGFDEASRAYVFPVARRVLAESGQVVAQAAALVDIDYFKRFYQNMDLGPVPSLGLLTLDGEVIARQPLKVEDLRSAAPGTLAVAAHLARADAGTFRDRTMDGLARVVAYRVLAPRRLVVWVGVADEEASALWRLRAVRVALLLAAGLAVMTSLTVLLVRELARQRRAALDMQALNQDLERSNADLEQFAYIASHDLKEPLRNIASYVQLLQRRYEGKLDPDADAFIGYTVDGVRRMQAIINELLAYSRVGTGKLEMIEMQAGAAVTTALAQLKVVIAEAQAAVEVKGPLPVVRVDPPQLASLFQNLIGNGVKYRRPDVRPEVTIGAEDRGGEWGFYVADNGIGIEPQYHQQIFDLFKRLHARDRYGGTGIGLATCKRVVGRHGGRIWVESEPGKGSTFWFTLPKVFH